MNGGEPSGSDRAARRPEVHYLVRLMKRYDLTALDVSDGKVQIRLRRAVAARRARRAAAAPPPPTLRPPRSPARAGPPRSRGRVAAVGRPTAPKTVVIESPMVGTYFASSAPDAPPFVSVGSVVHPDTIVCIIEAMKVFTDIPAGVSGTIAEILVKNGQAVEFGQPFPRDSGLTRRGRGDPR